MKKSVNSTCIYRKTLEDIKLHQKSFFRFTQCFFLHILVGNKSGGGAIEG